MLKLNPLPFFANWAGHPVASLATIYAHIRSLRPGKPVIWLAGDSSLDNKAWVPSDGPGGEALPVDVPEIYQDLFDPSQPKPDVAFWLNHLLGSKATAINTAVEATMLRDRDTKLLPHDDFIRDNIGEGDVLVVSVGANDIALSPNASTMRHMFQLAWLTPRSSVERGTASSLTYFKQMFGDQTKAYIERIIEKQKPRAVIVCMIYYPLESSVSTQTSWADAQLKSLGYGMYPGQLQAAIKKMYEQATCEMRIEGTTVIPCPLYETMDGKVEADYTSRVEPSVQGGQKMAALFTKLLDNVLTGA
ncbi:hypothetical protein BAUCODRAFT_410290 [Baudoinia panamericana UAMH 10762]|uniref:SGNH hydrolase-type esterase domain-containing protein n=1 Tax=Baudoinia panamericana (strain UAMH 10762) TaxID=717646 RepID=M2NG90_BAUPA|nr:uncharacterized protein BAUCODRAFT_410290 [Baudoinia panamericana UAMH 10762]EMC97990.1 hypothetical protein BAUCODRAFT_410290 [Baudoinia panamericana UAMH 10762]